MLSGERKACPRWTLWRFWWRSHRISIARYIDLWIHSLRHRLGSMLWSRGISTCVTPRPSVLVHMCLNFLNNILFPLPSSIIDEVAWPRLGPLRMSTAVQQALGVCDWALSSWSRSSILTSTSSPNVCLAASQRRCEHCACVVNMDGIVYKCPWKCWRAILLQLIWILRDERRFVKMVTTLGGRRAVATNSIAWPACRFTKLGKFLLRLLLACYRFMWIGRSSGCTNSDDRIG